MRVLPICRAFNLLLPSMEQSMPSLVASNGDDDAPIATATCFWPGPRFHRLCSGVRLRLLGVHVGPVCP